MALKTTEERLRDIVVDQLGVSVEEVTADAKFSEDFGIDSLDEIELIMAAEEAFGIEIPDGDTEFLDTFSKSVEYIEKRLGRADRKQTTAG